MRTFIQRSTRATLAVFMAVICVLGTLGFPLSALADEAALQTNVRGTDSLETTATEWELIRIGDHQGEPLYIDVIKEEGGQQTYLSYRQKYDLAQAQTNGPAPEKGVALSHILSLALEDATPEELYGSATTTTRYQIAVWDAQRNGNPLYEGTVYPVYGHLVSEGQVEDEGYVLLGIRTANDDEKSAPKNLGAGNAIYKEADGGRDAYGLQRVGEQKVDNAFDENLNAFVATYEKTATDAATGTVTYKTDEGDIVRTESFAGIEGEGLDVPIDQSFFSNGQYYRTLSSLGSTKRLTVAQPNATVRVVAVEDMAQANAYQLTISYEAENSDGLNQVLWTDSVDIHGAGYQYSLPLSFSSAASHSEGVAFYSFTGVQGSSTARVDHEWGNPLVLTGDLSEALFDQDANGHRVLHALYSSSEDTKEATFTVVEIDGTNATEIGRKSGKVTPDQDFTYEPASFEHDGATYVPAASNTQTISYKWDDLTAGKDLMVYVYYVPEDYVPGAGYDIQVRYQDIATGVILKTDTYPVNPEMTDFLTVVGDESFSADDGERYVRLPGQEGGIRHAFYSPTRVYTIYYRNVNDQLNANVVIQRTQIIDTPRAAAAGTAGGGITAAPIAAAATGAALPATDAGVAPGDATTIINDDGNPLASPEGQSTAEQRIDDDANPLAAGFQNPAVMAGSIAGLAALLALLFFFIFKRKKNADASDTKNA